MKKYEYLEIDYTAKGVVFLCTDKHKEVINSYAENGYRYVGFIPTEIDAKAAGSNPVIPTNINDQPIEISTFQWVFCCLGFC